MSLTRMEDLDLSAKTVLIREDLNVPIQNGKIINDARLQSSLPTIKLALSKGAAVIICSHLGRPTEGSYDEKYSLKPIADYLSKQLNISVPLYQNYLNQPLAISPGDVVLLENVRFNLGEKLNSESLAEKYADLCDVFIMDAFGTAHRAQASTEGVIISAAKQGKIACAGPLLTHELEALEKALKTPNKPLLAIVGGSKVSTKLEVLTSLAKICDQIIVGGGIANTFLAAKGYAVGGSLYEPDMVAIAKKIMEVTTVLLPKQVVVADKNEIDFGNFIASLNTVQPLSRHIDKVGENEIILDIVAEGSEHLVDAVMEAATIIWNGPVGVFEVDAFSQGTKMLAKAVSTSKGFSMAGGGDTLAAIYKFGIEDKVSYLSTGGGAFLEFVEGKKLPVVEALEKNSEKSSTTT